MFGWAIAFLVIALIAVALGFGVVAGTALADAKIIFVDETGSHLATKNRNRNIFPTMEPSEALGVSRGCVLSTGHLLREIWHERNPHKQG